MSKSYDSRKHSFNPPYASGKHYNISLLVRLACFVVFLQTALDSVALQKDDSARCRHVCIADSTEIHFSISGSGLDLGWDVNGVKLEGLKQRINERAATDSSLIISSLRIVGSASPEGPEKYNRILSEKRANAIYEYLTEFVAIPDSITSFEYLGGNWKRLYELVVSDPSVPSYPEVLALLSKAATDSGKLSTENNILLNRLKSLRGGEPYTYIYRNLFPALRSSCVYVEYERRTDNESDNKGLDEIAPAGSQPVDSDVTVSEEIESAPDSGTDPESAVSPMLPAEDIPSVEFSTDERKPFYMDIRTNMLYDIAAVPNIGAEFYVGRNISVYGNWMYGWWDNDARHRYWRIYGGELGARWWFGHKAHAKPLTGHHIGIYGGVLTFDFEWGDTGYMGGKPGGTLWDRPLVNAGIEYGYSLPISNRLNIDFSIGLGHMGGNYIKYFPFDDDYYRQKEYKLRFFGPTKLEVSLVWLIGRGNYNNRKGGDAR